MLTLDTLNVMLAVSEEGLIEEVVITLLASPQLAAFFEKFPKLRKAMTDDLPRWRDNLRQRFKETEVPPELTEEVAGYQQCQRLSTPQFIAQLQQTLTLLDNVHSPFASRARALVTDNPSFTPALHTLFLQRWRLSLVVGPRPSISSCWTKSANSCSVRSRANDPERPVRTGAGGE